MICNFSDKVVLVTGGSTGIGAAVAKAFAREGASVAVNFNSSESEAGRVRDEITERNGVAEIFKANIADPEAVSRLVANVVSRFGKLDIVVCNAGGLVGRTGLTDITNDFYSQVMDLNIRSVVAACAAAIPHLLETKGNVIVTGSVAAQLGGGPGASLYAASKAAVQNLIKTYAKEYASSGVRFNAVSPGTISTLFHQKHTKTEVLETIKNSIPMKRLGTPEDCAGAYLFLASDDLAGYITGQTIEVNGGQFMP